MMSSTWLNEKSSATNQSTSTRAGWASAISSTRSYACSAVEPVATVAKGLRSGYLDQGLTSLAQIQRKYAPVGTANDPANLNSNWLRNTTLLYGELGGDPNGSVALR